MKNKKSQSESAKKKEAKGYYINNQEGAAVGPPDPLANDSVYGKADGQTLYGGGGVDRIFATGGVSEADGSVVAGDRMTQYMYGGSPNAQDQEGDFFYLGSASLNGEGTDFVMDYQPGVDTVVIPAHGGDILWLRARTDISPVVLEASLANGAYVRTTFEGISNVADLIVVDDQMSPLTVSTYDASSVIGGIVPPAPTSWVQLGQDIDGEAFDDRSGYSVSISADGRTVAIGAPHNDDNGDESGHVRVFQLNNGSWVQLGQDIDGEAAGDYTGAYVSISADGRTVAIGARYKDGYGENSGPVRVYQLIYNRWSQVGQDIDDEATGDQSGRSVSISADGQTVAIGTYLKHSTSIESGQVRVYQLSNNAWIQLGQDIDGEHAGSRSGSSVSLSADGQIVAIGADGNDQPSEDAGHVRVYQLTNNSWVQLGQDIDGEAFDDQSGRSVSISADGQIVAIGGFGNGGNGDESGHVRVYRLNNGSWDQIGQDIDGEAAGDWSGFSVSISADGQIVAIGARENDGNGRDSGHVRVYQLKNGSWAQLGQDIDGEAVDTHSGFSVSISADGQTIAIGAPYNNGNGRASGHVRVYRLE